MADINSPVEIGVTTGPIRGSRKIYVGARTGSGIRVAMREIDLEGGEPSVRVYDTSGPYTDPDAHIDINAGLPQLRRDWIMARGDVEDYQGREVKPEDKGQLGPDPGHQFAARGGAQAFGRGAAVGAHQATHAQVGAAVPARDHHHHLVHALALDGGQDRAAGAAAGFAVVGGPVVGADAVGPAVVRGLRIGDLVQEGQRRFR